MPRNENPGYGYLGPGMSDHYLSLIRFPEVCRYLHIGTDSKMKSFLYIQNAVCQIERLANARTELNHRKTFYIADRDALNQCKWFEAISLALSAHPLLAVSYFR